MGIEYTIENKADYTKILFMLSKGMVRRCQCQNAGIHFSPHCSNSRMTDFRIFSWLCFMCVVVADWQENGRGSGGADSGGKFHRKLLQRRLNEERITHSVLPGFASLPLAYGWAGKFFGHWWTTSLYASQIDRTQPAAEEERTRMERSTPVPILGKLACEFLHSDRIVQGSRKKKKKVVWPLTSRRHWGCVLRFHAP